MISKPKRLLSIIPKGMVHAIDLYAVVLDEFSSHFFWEISIRFEYNLYDVKVL